MAVRLLLALASMVMGSQAPEPSGDLALVENGAAKATIVLADNADAWARMAAEWVREYVEKVSGARLAIAKESEGSGGVLISIGRTKLAEKAGVKADDLDYDGCKMVVKGKVLFLIGRDTPGCNPVPNAPIDTWSYEKEVVKRYGDTGAQGSCRAATWFLEEVCGVRWLMPCPEGVYIPTTENINIPNNLSRSFEPAFIYHSNRSLYGSPLSRPAAWANNYRVALKLHTAGGHTVPHWIAAATYFDEHPEYFAMIEGHRTPIGNHVCVSNPKVQELIEKGIASWFESGYDLVQLGLADGYRPCECPKCRVLDGRLERLPTDMGGAQAQEYERSHAWDRVNLPQRQIAERLLAKYPEGKYIHWLVYGPTGTPSEAYDRLPDNCIVEICRNGAPSEIQRWSGKAGGLTVYHYWYDHTLWGGIGVRVSPAEAADMVRFYAANGVKGIHGGGGYNWGLIGLTYYVTGRLMGDPSRDLDQLTDEYCTGLYGNAAREMEKFFALLHTKSDYKFQDRQMTIMERFTLYYPPDFVERCEELLREAERAAVTEREKKFVRVTRDEWDYIRLLTRAFWLYRGYQVNQAVGDREQLRRAVEAFDEYRTRMCSFEGDYVRDYFPGHGYLCCAMTTGVGGAGYGSSWADVRKRTDVSKVPGTGLGLGTSLVGPPLTLDFKSTDIQRTFRVAWADQPPALDGILDEAVWKKAKPVFMRGQTTTEVKGLYDKDNLYVSYVCGEPQIDPIDAHSTARDSSVCLMSCIELYLNPESSTYTNRYYHFIIAAAEDAVYDDRTGFNRAGDFGDQDYSWNAAGLDYGVKVDKESKRWVIEMVVPFRDIGATTPKPGQAWLGNLARERHGGNDLYQWSKTGGFNDPKSFGKFVFEKP